MSDPDRDRRLLLACLRVATSSHDGEALQALRQPQRIMASRQTALADAVELALELDAAAERLWQSIPPVDRVFFCRREGVSDALVMSDLPDAFLRPALRRMVLDGTCPCWAP